MIAPEDRSYLYPHAWPPASGALDAEGPAGRAAFATEALAGTHARANGHFAERAVIGNGLRIPAVWCEFGSCIGRFADTAALGHADVTARAIAAGWQRDALGRMACPVCVQQDVTFITLYPVVPHVPAETTYTETMYTLRYAEAGPAEAEAVWDGDTVPDGPEWDLLAESSFTDDWADTPSRPLRLAVTTDGASGRTGWFRHRDAGRHRQRI
jgi:hypothetical protein